MTSTIHIRNLNLSSIKHYPIASDAGEQTNADAPDEGRPPAGANSRQPQDPNNVANDVGDKNEANAITIDAIPNAKTYRNWRYAFQEAVASASGTPTSAFERICQTYEAETHEELRDGAFQSLDAKTATGLNKILSGDFQRKVNLVKGIGR